MRSLNGFSQALSEDYESELDDTARDYLNRIRNSTVYMAELIENLLKLSRINRTEISNETVDMSRLCEEVVDELRSAEPDCKVRVDIQPGITAQGDPQLLRSALANLIGNAWKFTRNARNPSICFGTAQRDGATVYEVEDNGAGFDPAYADRLFTPFQRLHPASDFPGTGIGLATVQRIIHRHGGSIRADAEPERGARFYYTLGKPLTSAGPEGQAG